MADFLPRRDAELLTWSTSFRDNVVADPEAFALTRAQADSYAAAHDAYAAAYLLASSPETAGPSKRLAKDLARAELERVARWLAAVVRAAKTVSSEQRYALGLRPRERAVRVAAPPAEPPRVKVYALRDATVQVMLVDAESPTHVRKAAGAAGASVFTFVGDAPPRSIDAWRFHGNVTRPRLSITFPPGLPIGTKVWVTARWYGTRGQAGPVADPCCAYLCPVAPQLPMLAAA